MTKLSPLMLIYVTFTYAGILLSWIIFGPEHRAHPYLDIAASMFAIYGLYELNYSYTLITTAIKHWHKYAKAAVYISLTSIMLFILPYGVYRLCGFTNDNALCAVLCTLAFATLGGYIHKVLTED